MKEIPPEAVSRIDMQLAEVSHLLAGLIFIAENIEDEQAELLRHCTVTLAWVMRDKLSEALKDTARLAT